MNLSSTDESFSCKEGTCSVLLFKEHNLYPHVFWFFFFFFSIFGAFFTHYNYHFNIYIYTHTRVRVCVCGFRNLILAFFFLNVCSALDGLINLWQVQSRG